MFWGFDFVDLRLLHIAAKKSFYFSAAAENAAMARSATRPSTSSSGSVTLTVEVPSSSSLQLQVSQTLILRLKRPRKKVTWKEGTVDNEFLGRKSSKKCCIFHKQKPFDEDDSETDDERDSHAGDGRSDENRACCSHGEGSRNN